MRNSPDRKENTKTHSGSLFKDFDPTSRKEWEDQIEADLKGADYKKKLVWHTGEGFDVLPFYMRGDIESIAFTEEKPGSYPFTRGHKGSIASWKIGQPILSRSLDQARKQIDDALENGCEALYIPFKIDSKKSANEFSLNGPDLQKQLNLIKFQN